MKVALPPLPFAKDALAPYISAETIDTHYEKHHQGYVDKLRKALRGDEAQLSVEELVRKRDDRTFNLAAQVWNHDFYWHSLRAPGGSEPSAELRRAVERDFGSVEACKEELAELANGEFGSGWAWLVVAPESGSLRVISTHDADNPLTTSEVPLCTIDVWEHAYYLDYKSERDRYVTAVLDHLLNWEFIDRNWQSSRR